MGPDKTKDFSAGSVYASGPGESPDPAQASISRKTLEAKLKELSAVARSVAADAGLDVHLGNPGGGSACRYGGLATHRVDRVKRVVVIDPEHLLDEANKFIIAHEGMHAYVTRSPFDRSVHIALEQACSPHSLYQEIGFASLFDYLEDCGGNEWLTKNYPAFKEQEQKFYDEMLRVENPEAHTGESQSVMARLGFFPRFAQFGSEVMKRWHTGSYSTTVDPGVLSALQKHQDKVDAFIKSFPTSQHSSAELRDGLFVRRFLIAAVNIMPTIRKLVDEDKAQAGMQQFLNQQTQSTQQGHEQSGQTSSIGGAGSELSPQANREVNEKAANHRQKLRGQLQEQLDQLAKHLKASTASDIKDTSEQIEVLRKAIEENFDSADHEAKQEVKRHLDQLEKLHESIDSQGPPIHELSENTKTELKSLYEKLAQREREALEKLGEEILKDLEDAIREQLEGKMLEQPAPTHRQNTEASKKAVQAAAAYQKMIEDAGELENIRRSKLSLWDAAKEEVSETITRLYTRLEKILRPTVPEYESGYADGSRPHLPTVMQAKADPKLKSKMWEKKSIALEREFAFSLLVDNSGSMTMDERHLHARQCAVLLSEVLTRLRIPFEISIFSDRSQIVKKFDERPDKEKKKAIGEAINGDGGGTNDYMAVKQCVEQIGGRSEEHKFLIVVTDGGSSNGTELQKEIKNALDQGVRVIGLGIGSGTTDVDKYYPIGRGELSIDPKDKETALGPYFAKLLEGILKNPQQFIAKALREKVDSGK